MLERIPGYYISDECAHITLPFYNNITIFSSDVCTKGVLCHYNFHDDSQNVNRYLTDDRRIIFPYSNIPMYKGFFGKYYVNQLFEYNKHYICISNGVIRDRYVLKDNDTAIMLNRRLVIPLDNGGNVYSCDYIYKMLSSYKDVFLFDRYGNEYKDDVDCDYDIKMFINNGGGLLIYKDSIDKTIIKLIRIYRDIGMDNYIYKESKISLNEYSLEELKYFSSKIKDIKDICIHSCINSNIDVKEIREAKRLVRKNSK